MATNYEITLKSKHCILLCQEPYKKLKICQGAEHLTDINFQTYFDVILYQIRRIKCA